MRITLKDGYSMNLADKAIDNMELVDALAEMTDDTDILAVSKVVRLILGEEEREKLYDHLRTGDGRVPIQSVSETIKEIFAAYGDSGKN